MSALPRRRTARIRASSSAKEYGLARKSSAPRLSRPTRSRSEDRPEQTMTGTELRWRILVSTSEVPPSRSKSRMTRSAGCGEDGLQRSTRHWPPRRPCSPSASGSAGGRGGTLPSSSATRMVLSVATVRDGREQRHGIGIHPRRCPGRSDRRPGNRHAPPSLGSGFASTTEAVTSGQVPWLHRGRDAAWAWRAQCPSRRRPTFAASPTMSITPLVLPHFPCGRFVPSAGASFRRAAPDSGRVGVLSVGSCRSGSIGLSDQSFAQPWCGGRPRR